VLAVDRGQVIEIALDGGAPLRLRLAGDRTGTISTRRLSTQGLRREIDRESGLDDIVVGLVSGVEATLRTLNDTWEHRNGREREDPHYDPQRLAEADITLTIDRAMQMQSVDSLRRFAVSPDSPLNGKGLNPHYENGLWLDDGAPVPFPHITLTIMDADNGDLLAMGSYPNSQSATEGLERSAALTGPRARLLREHLAQELTRTSLQLRPHAIGSIFKPFFAWAAGSADPELIDFVIDNRSRSSDWSYGNLDRDRELTRCMVSGRRTTDKKKSHLDNAYEIKTPFWHCKADGTGEDICGALAISDTYFFLELAARVSLEARDLSLPTQAEAPEDRNRDAKYELWKFCGPQRVYPPSGSSERTCTTPDGQPFDSPQITKFLPDSCPDPKYTKLCAMIGTLGVQLQPTNKTNDPSTQAVDGFLGPLAGLVEELSSNTPTGCTSGSATLLDGFRWVVPSAPQWPQDLMRACTPDLEAFLEGGGLNYWNDVVVAQTFSRLFVNQPTLHARLVAAIDDKQSKVTPEVEPEPVAPIGRLVDSECADSDAARCLVLRGLEGAMRRGGTLGGLQEIQAELQAPHDAAGISVQIRGKTGTLRAPFPNFVRQPKVGWVHSMSPRKSVHTALLVEVADAEGSARHYVVYLSVNGVDDALLSSDAAKFFSSSGPGYAVLQRVVDDAVLDLGERP
jgi:hypothetical protein